MRQPREAVGEQALLELPAGKLDEGARARSRRAKRELAEEIGKGARSWQPPDHASTRRRASRTRSATSTSPPTCSSETAEADEDERIEIVARPLAELDDVIEECRDAKTLVGLLWFRAFCALSRALQPQGMPRRADEPRSVDGHDRRNARVEAPRSSTWCSTSSPTWSSSAGCRATRSRPTAPTCCSSARFLAERRMSALDASPRRRRDFLTGLAAGDGDRRPASPATIHRKAACLRSFYRHLRREGVRDSDPDRHAERAPAQPQAAAGAGARRGGAAARPAARHRRRPRCATARCSS